MAMAETSRSGRYERLPEYRSGVFAWAACALLLGILVYVFDRGGRAAFLPAVLFSPKAIALFGPIANVLPSFAHTFSFTLFIALILRPANIYGVCGFWMAIEIACELLQLPDVGQLLRTAEFDSTELGKYIVLYSTNGTFDVRDLAAIVLGGVCATWLWNRYRGDHNETNTDS